MQTMSASRPHPLDQANYFLGAIKANWQNIANLDEHLMLALRLCEQLARRAETYPGAEGDLLAARRAAAIQELLATPKPVVLDLLIALNEQVGRTLFDAAVTASDTGDSA
ncbi:MAG: hypothetical protein IPG66_02055 [Hydrogenophilales bacterium]|nr:hypothetical protein [Hydrogenophilales bacterium]